MPAPRPPRTPRTSHTARPPRPSISAPRTPTPSTPTTPAPTRQKPVTNGNGGAGKGNPSGPGKSSAGSQPPARQSVPATPHPSHVPTLDRPSATPYHRVLLKLSGEAFGAAASGGGIDPQELSQIAAEVKDAFLTGVQLAVVVGGGNFIRGAKFAKSAHIHQAVADQMGMLATVLNGLALKEALLHIGVDSRVMTAVDIRAVAEPFVRGRALRHMEKRRVVILVAGTGNPFCTTDTCAALRATELECDLLMKATKVDGVYSADPKKDPTAKKFDALTFQTAIAKGLGVMDMTALAMCQENNVPVLVFDFKAKGNIRKAIEGDSLGTLVSPP